MDLAEARVLLGVSERADASAVRDAYRRKIRSVHPDVAGSAHTGDAARLNEAYALIVRLRRTRPDPAPAPVDPQPTAPSPRQNGDEARMRVPWTPGEAFARVVEAGHALGEVTFVERASGLVEVIVDVDGEACSLVCSFHVADGSTEVRATLESIERVATLDPVPVMRALAGFFRGDA